MIIMLQRNSFLRGYLQDLNYLNSTLIWQRNLSGYE